MRCLNSGKLSLIFNFYRKMETFEYRLMHFLQALTLLNGIFKFSVKSLPASILYSLI